MHRVTMFLLFEYRLGVDFNNALSGTDALGMNEFDPVL